MLTNVVPQHSAALIIWIVVIFVLANLRKVFGPAIEWCSALIGLASVLGSDNTSLTVGTMKMDRLGF